MAGLAAAVRARDGRGPRTALERLVPQCYGLQRPSAVTRALYDGRIPETRIGQLAPIVFAAAGDGDVVARSIVDRLADELATMAIALARRTSMTRLAVQVILAGGVFRTNDQPFLDRIGERIRAVVPKAQLLRLELPPVAGAALEGINRLGHRDARSLEAARERVRASLGPWQP
jgi:N-acetylglucosamine kinase-like BadF-type ATPase